jgi:RNA polymerase sigma-70 factor (ECF subfamily)
MPEPPADTAESPLPNSPERLTGDDARAELTPEFVFREYAPRIYHLARRLLGNDADAEDVTQDVLLQVVRKLHTFRGDSALPTWLHRVTLNAALAHREKRANRQKHENATGDEATLEGTNDPPGNVKLPRTSPAAIALQGEQRELIDRAIKRLPDQFRDVYVLADVEGLQNSDVADMLGLSVSAVKSRLHRARQRMRDALAPHFEEATP